MQTLDIQQVSHSYQLQHLQCFLKFALRGGRSNIVVGLAHNNLGNYDNLHSLLGTVGWLCKFCWRHCTGYQESFWFLQIHYSWCKACHVPKVGYWWMKWRSNNSTKRWQPHNRGTTSVRPWDMTHQYQKGQGVHPASIVWHFFSFSDQYLTPGRTVVIPQSTWR